MFWGRARLVLPEKEVNAYPLSQSHARILSVARPTH